MARPNTDPDVGRRIRVMRLERGWTQKELAKRAGVSRPAVSQWESGKTKNYKHDSLNNIAWAFGITVDELLRRPPLHIAEEPKSPYTAKGGGALTREEEVLLEKYRHLAPDDRTRLQEIVSALDAAKLKRAKEG